LFMNPDPLKNTNLQVSILERIRVHKQSDLITDKTHSNSIRKVSCITVL
jgi:hypothetical protein